jgi:uncharacterized membrane protein
MDYYTLFLYLIVLIKISYSFSILLQFTQTIKWKVFPESFYKQNKENQERIENLYIFLMAVVLIYVFKNRQRSYKFSNLEVELFFVFGIILVIRQATNWYQKNK